MAEWVNKVLGMFDGGQMPVEPGPVKLPRRLTTVPSDNKIGKRMDQAYKAMEEIRHDNSILQHSQARSFDAAATDRTKATWMGVQATANEEIRRALYRLRARSRDLAQNNDWMRKFLNLVVSNVVGPQGFNLQVIARDPATGEALTQVNDIIKKAFDDWSGRSCDISGRFSLAELERVLMNTVARDGEGLVRIIRGDKKSVGNKYGIALQILEVDRLDINRSTYLDNGNRVVMGVETNAYGRPVAYYIFNEMEPIFQGSVQAGYQSVRVDADDIFHLYRADRPEQQRGFPWAHTAMVTLEHLGAFQEAALVASRVGASRMGFITTPDGNASPMADGMDEIGNLYEDFSPGKIGVLPPGYDYKEPANSYPDQFYGEFVKVMLRSIGSGVGVSYNSLANDLEGVSFSSIRSGVLEERDQWKTVQAWFIDSFLNPLFSAWLEQALLNNALKFGVTGKPLSIADIDLYNVPQWRGRRWDWVDPLKDMNAKVIAINNGLDSRQNVLNELGRDLDDTWHELQQEADMAKDMDLPIAGLNIPEALTPSQNEAGVTGPDDTKD